jgi:peptide/nickel transport system substrate-binding protein
MIRMMKRSHVILAVLLAVSLLVTGCGGQAATPPAEKKPVGPPAPAKKTLRIGLSAEPDSLDPHLLTMTAAMRVMEQMYSSLLRLSPTLEIQPDIAKEWMVNKEGTVFTFKLRSDVKFHNGRGVTAEDVKYSIERMIDPKVASPWAYLFADLDSIKVIDATTVEIKMKKPAAFLLAALATPFVAITPREVVQQKGDLKTTASGTGPFRLKEWVPGQRIVLEKYPDYHEKGFPKVDEIIWTFTEDPRTREQQLLSGAIDLDIDVPLTSIPTYKNSKGIEMLGGEVVSYSYVLVNTTRKPFNDVRVRQAIAWALDREEVVSVAVDGHGVPLLGGCLPSNHWAYSNLVVYPKPDQAKAKQLLSQAGLSAGLKLEIIAAKATAGVAQVIQQQLAKVGITATILQLESGAALTRIRAKDFDLQVTQWGTLIDPDDFLYPMFVTNGGWNRSGFSDPQVDKVLTQGRSVLDPSERKKIYLEAEKLIAEKAPYVFLYRPKRYAAFQSYVKGLKHEAANTRLSLREVTVDKPAQTTK